MDGRLCASASVCVGVGVGCVRVRPTARLHQPGYRVKQYGALSLCFLPEQDGSWSSGAPGVSYLHRPGKEDPGIRG